MWFEIQYYRKSIGKHQNCKKKNNYKYIEGGREKLKFSEINLLKVQGSPYKTHIQIIFDEKHHVFYKTFSCENFIFNCTALQWISKNNNSWIFLLSVSNKFLTNT